MLMDLVCAMIFIVLIMVLIVIIRAPKYIPLHSKMDHIAIGTAARACADMNLKVYVVGLIAKRRPEILPPAMREAFLNKNKAELEQLISEYKNWDGSIDIMYRRGFFRSFFKLDGYFSHCS